jgi:hypothetical protein
VEQPRQVRHLNQFLTTDRALGKVLLHLEMLMWVERAQQIRTD